MKCVSLSRFFLFSASRALSSRSSLLSSLSLYAQTCACGVCLRGRRVWRAVSLSRARKSFSLVFKMTNSNFLKNAKRETKRDKQTRRRERRKNNVTQIVRGVSRAVVRCVCFIHSFARYTTYIFYSINILIYRSIWFCRRLVDPRELPSLRWYLRRRRRRRCRLSGIRRRRRNRRP